MSSTMKPVYIIARWKEWFTCSQSNKVVQNPTWTPIPVMKDIRARRRLFMLDGGVEAYGVLVAIVGVAAQMPTRGVLIDDTGAVLDALDIASLTGLDASMVERAIGLLTKADVGYLDRRGRNAAGELIPYDPSATGLFAPPADDAGSTLPARSQHATSAVDDAGSQRNEDESEDERRADQTRGALRFVAADPPAAAASPSPSLEKAREPSSLSSSPRQPEKAAYEEKASEPPAWRELDRQVEDMKFKTLVHRLWAPRGTAQYRSDLTDTPQLFDQYIWPAAGPPPPDMRQRMKTAEALADAALRNGKNKMAWFKNEMLHRLGRVGESPPARRAGAG